GVAVCYAIGPIILSRRLNDVPALGVVAASLVSAAVVSAPFAAVRWPSSMPSGHVVESVLGLAVVCTSLAFLVFFALIAEVGPVRATVITYVNPAIAAVLGVTILSEHLLAAVLVFTIVTEPLSAGMLVGFALILAGCVLATGRGPEPVAESRGMRRVWLVVTPAGRCAANLP